MAEQLPLSAAQRGIWLGQQLDPTSPAYNVAEYVVIDGPVDLARLAHAIRSVIDSTEGLHSRFRRFNPGEEGLTEPRQALNSPDWELQTLDLRQSPKAMDEAISWMRADCANVCDLERGPLFAQALLRIGDEQVLWYQRAHHICLDGYGFALVAQQVAKAYRGVALKPGAGLAAVIAEDAAYQASPAAAADLAWWQAELTSKPFGATLATTSALPSTLALRHETSLDPELVALLQQRARELGVSWVEVLLAAISAYVARQTGLAGASLGLPLMARMGSAAARTPCMAMNIVPLLVPVAATATLAELAQSVAATLRDLRPRARARYEALRQAQRAQGGRVFGPVVNVMPFEAVLDFGVAQGVVKYLYAGPVEDLSVTIHAPPGATRFTVQLEANPACYDAGVLAGHAQSLLEAIAVLVQRPHAALGACLPAAPGADLTGADLALAQPSLLSLVQAIAQASPELPALEDGDECLSYAELWSQIEARASGLQALGVGRGANVALVLERSSEAWALLLAIWRLGACALPLDPHAPEARLGALLQTAAPLLVIAETGNKALSGPWRWIESTALNTAPKAATGLPELPGAEERAYILYTSGSTGEPKGVAVAHGALAHFTQAAYAQYGLGAGERVLQFAPMHFDACFEELGLAICAGGTLVLRDEAMVQSVAGLLSGCAERAISVLDLPTALWHEVALTLSEGGAALPACVRTVIIGGEAALPERVARWRRAVSNEVRLINTYGPTEATVVALSAELSTWEPGGPVPIGRPLPGLRAVVLTADGRVAPPETEGDLWLSGPTLAQGYVARDDLTAERFVALGQLPGSPRAYRTGDRAWLGGDGQLYFAGRDDDEFKLSGVRIAPAEVESQLLGLVGVRAAAVVGQSDPGGARALWAYVVVDENVSTPQKLREALATRLPAAMVPGRIIVVETLPRTPSGKIDRKALRGLERPAAQAVADNPLEQAIVAVWEAVLGGPVEDLDSDFFALGGQSLQTIQVASRLGARLGRSIAAADLFRHPTVRGLALSLGRPAGDNGAQGLPAELVADSILEPALGAHLLGQQRSDAAACIVITGATGYVGAFLLRAALNQTQTQKVVCLVRAATPEAGLARLRSTLAGYAIALDETLWERVEALPADLSQPYLGLAPATFAALAERATKIYHAAAVVSVMRGYRSVRAANVQGTHEVLRLALTGPATEVHHLSTIAIGGHSALPEALIEAHPGLSDGYQQSKWAAEQLISQAAARGLPCAIYRLPRVSAPLMGGAINPDDLFWRLVRASVAQGALPRIPLAEHWTPADFAAELILSGGALDGQVYNLAAGAPMTLAAMGAALADAGYGLEELPLEAWRARLQASQSGADQALAAFFDLQTPDAPLQAPAPSAANALTLTAAAGLEWPRLGADYLANLLQAAQSAGLLPAPAAHDKQLQLG